MPHDSRAAPALRDASCASSASASLYTTTSQLESKHEIGKLMEMLALREASSASSASASLFTMVEPSRILMATVVSCQEPR